MKLSNFKLIRYIPSAIWDVPSRAYATVDTGNGISEICRIGEHGDWFFVDTGKYTKEYFGDCAECLYRKHYAELELAEIRREKVIYEKENAELLREAALRNQVDREEP